MAIDVIQLLQKKRRRTGLSTTKLEVRPIAPPTPPVTPPPPQRPVQQTEVMPQMPALPPMEMAMDTAPSNLTLPPFEVDAKALRLPVVTPTLQAPNMATPPRRLVTPDLKRYYPRRLIKLRVEGETKLELYIDATGAVERVEIISSVPPQRFESAAIQAMKRVRYEPARDEKGNPIAGRVIETLEWRISK